MPRPWSICFLFLALSWVGPYAAAQTARTGGAPNAQMLAQMQQLASERTALQAENARLKTELDAAHKERDTLKKSQQSVDMRAKNGAAALAQVNAQRDAAAQELKQTKEKTQELIGKFRETIQSLRDVETQLTTSKQTLTAREQELKSCRERNAALYDLNGQVLTRLEHQSMWSRVASAEPFTKIKRVELENLADDYKARADDQRIQPVPAPPAPPIDQKDHKK